MYLCMWQAKSLAGADPGGGGVSLGIDFYCGFRETKLMGGGPGGGGGGGVQFEILKKIQV